MAEINQHQIRALRHGGQLKWTKEMNSDLLKCKRRAKGMANSNDPPRYSDGQKRSYVYYEGTMGPKRINGLNISPQNLRKQAA